MMKRILMLLLSMISVFANAQTICWGGNGQVSYQRWDTTYAGSSSAAFYSKCPTDISGHRVQGNYGSIVGSVTIDLGNVPPIYVPTSAVSSTGSASGIGTINGPGGSKGGFTVYQGYIYIPCFTTDRSFRITTNGATGRTAEFAATLYIADTTFINTSNYNVAYYKTDSTGSTVCSSDGSFKGTKTNVWVKFALVVSDGVGTHSFNIQWKPTGGSFVNVPTTSVSSVVTGTSTVANCYLGCNGTTCTTPPTPTITASATKVCYDTPAQRLVTLTAVGCPTPNTVVWSNAKTTDTIKVSTPGSYTVQCKASATCISAASAPYVVGGVPRGTIKKPNLVQSCFDIVLAPTVAVSGISYKWLTSTDSLAGTASSYTTSKSGTFKMQLFYASDPTCTATSEPLSVVVSSILEYPIIGDSKSCYPIDLSLAENGSLKNVKWYDSKNVQIGTGRLLTATTSDTYNVKGELGYCKINSTKSIVIGGVIPITINKEGDLKICEGGSALKLTASSTVSPFKWYNAANDALYSTSTSLNFDHTVGSIDLYVTNETGACKGKSETVSVRGHRKPSNFDFTPLKSEYCNSDSKISLSGVPTGGLFFSRQNNEGGAIKEFDPTKFVPGRVTIGYVYEGEGNCIFTKSQDITILGGRAITIIPGKESVCNNEDPFGFAGEPAGGVFTSTNNGFTGNFFNPAKAKPGVEEIVYSYKYDNGCSGIARFNLTVKQVPDVTFSIPPILCPANGDFPLVASPKGGTFIGDEVYNSKLSVTNMVDRDVNITYRYTDPANNCTNNAKYTVAVRKPNFGFNDFEPVNCKNGSIDVEVKPIISNATYTFANATLGTLIGPKQTLKPTETSVFKVSQIYPQNPTCTLTKDLTVTVLDCVPIPQIGISKEVSPPIKEANETFTVKYTITIKNYGNEALRNVSLKEDLKAVFDKPTMKIQMISGAQLLKTPTELSINPLFNGINETEILLPNSRLALNETNQITFTLNIQTDGESGPFNNTVVANAVGIKTTKPTSDLSRVGSDPDPTGKLLPNIAENNIPTPVVFPSINAFFAEVMTPNADGANDTYLIKNVGACGKTLEVFNLNGQLLFSNAEYNNDWSGTYNGNPLPEGIYNAVVTLKNCSDSSQNQRKSILFSITR